MFEGLPESCGYVSRLALEPKLRGSVSIVAYHHLGDVINSADYALTHYFPLTLNEPFLQNSSLGTPYQKWSKFSNDDFSNVDENLRRLFEIGSNIYYLASTIGGAFNSDVLEMASWKDAEHWFRTFHKNYECCKIDPTQPRLTTSTVNINGWIKSGKNTFLPLWNRHPAEPAIHVPSIISKSVIEISDRNRVLDELRDGRERLQQLWELQEYMATEIRSHFDMDTILAAHRGMFYRRY